MSTATVTAPGQRQTARPSYRLTFAGALRSEVIKLTTLRSTWWSIGITALLTIGIGALIAASISYEGFDGIQAAVSPVQFTMLLAGILGVIAVTGEYSTGMIRSTLAAEPVRGAVLAAKAIVVALFLFVSSLVIFFAAALVAGPLLGANGLSIPWDDPAHSTLPILAASASMAVFALIGVAFGFLIRSGAGAIAATVGLLFVLPIVSSIFSAMPGAEWVQDLSNYLPMYASQYFISPVEGAALDATAAAIALAAWVVAGMLGAWAVLRTRDA